MGVVVIRIEYEILPSMNNWIAFVAAFSHEERVFTTRAAYAFFRAARFCLWAWRLYCGE